MKITNSSSCEIKELGVEKLQGSQLCVTYRNLEADISCPGDEGGPVQNIIRSGNYKTGEPDIYKIVGISSFGSEVCGTGFPSINTKVSSYIDWIEEIVWPQQ